MIVNLVKEGWEVIYQQAHALLAAQLAFAWRPTDRAARWVETVAAIAQHDDGQKYWAGKMGLTEAGAPANFTMQPFSLEQARQVLEEARFQGQWRSLLTSRHLSFLYEPLRGQTKTTDAFLDDQLHHQAAWRKALKVTKKEVQKAYALMQWCDRLSLILCRQELPEAERALEISTGPDGIRYDVTEASDGSVWVSPWPFELVQFTVSVEVSCLSQLQFKSEAELATALHQAPIVTKEWTLIKQK